MSEKKSTKGKYKGTKIKYSEVKSLLEECGCTFLWSEEKFKSFIGGKSKKKIGKVVIDFK